VGAIDLATQDPAQAVVGADLVILCTPVGLFGDLLRRIGPALAEGALVTDVGSTKRSVVAEAQKHLPSRVQFVGSHPMAGSEKRGVRFSRADLFRGALCIITPTPAAASASINAIEGFWRLLGMRTTQMSAEEHDRLSAMVSHIPHAAAAALVAMQSEQAAGLAGKGFFDTTRIAGGDGGLWRDILLDNADNVRDGIVQLQGQLAALLKKLERRDSGEIQEWLDRSAAKQQRWATQRQPEQDAE
jgi:prephenate dehydrogenase